MSSPAQDADETPSHPIIPSLRLESLDPQELFTKLTAVEHALPHLLLCLKPILARLGSTPSAGLMAPHPLSSGLDDERSREVGGEESAARAISDYMEILDEIQEVLRNAALYLRKTKTSPTALVPPPPTSIPTPFASALPSANPLLPGINDSVGSGAHSSNGVSSKGEEVELGLYASRIESKILKDLHETFLVMQEEQAAKGDSE